MTSHLSTTQHLKLHVDSHTGALCDALGRHVCLRGANVGALSKRAPYLPFALEPARGEDLGDTVARQSEWLFSRQASWGFDIARVPFSWEGLQPDGPDDWSDGYVSRLRAMLDAAHMHGLRVILDLHQDLWSRRFGGNGCPDWTLTSGMRARADGDKRLWFAGYVLDADVRACFRALWHNERGLQDHLLAMWARLLQEIGDHPALVALDLMNEPCPTHPRLRDFFERAWLPLVTTFIAQTATSHPQLLCLYSLPGQELFTPHETDHFPPRDTPFVFAPHLYDPCLLLTPKAQTRLLPTSAPIMEGLRHIQRTLGVPSLITEFGVSHGAGRAGIAWLEDVLDAMDRHHIGGTLWECSMGGDGWNGEDLNVLDPGTHQPRELLYHYARPHLRALAGYAQRVACDFDEKTARMSWRTSDAHAGVPTEIASSSLWYARPDLVGVRVSGHTSWQWHPDKPHTLLVVAAAGANVEVTLAPSV